MTAAEWLIAERAFGLGLASGLLAAAAVGAVLVRAGEWASFRRAPRSRRRWVGDVLASVVGIALGLAAIRAICAYLVRELAK